jgi:hypothetical protein
MLLSKTNMMLLVALLLVIFVTFLATKKERFSIDWAAAIKGVKESPTSDKKESGSGVVQVLSKDPPRYTWRQQVKPGLWICPDGTVDYGTNDDKQCLVSAYGPKVNGRCPYGTTPNTRGPWDRQCVKGYTTRKYINGAWRCYSDARDTGYDWGQAAKHNSDPSIDYMQCLLKSDVTSTTTRMWDGKGWSCPPGTIDTGLGWSDGWGIGHKQCRLDPNH